MMANFLFTQVLDTLAVTVFADQMSRAMRMYMTWKQNFEPFVVQAAVVYMEFDDHHAARGHLPGFRLLFTFHEVLLYYM